MPSRRNSSCRLSHDEVVYGKGSLIGKMPGDAWQKFANLRAYLGFMWTHPGKKLMFMGGEIAQDREWNHDRPLDWWLLDRPENIGVQAALRDLNHIYRNHPALCTGMIATIAASAGSVMQDREQSVFRLSALWRCRKTGPFWWSATSRPCPRLRLPGRRAGGGGNWREIMNTDAGNLRRFQPRQWRLGRGRGSALGRFPGERPR